MDQICRLKQIHSILTKNQAENNFPPDSLLILLGPTASGKTSLAVALAKEFDAEIISADSRQVFRQMDIGTGKDLTEYGEIPYHLINIKEPGDRYQVNEFRKDFFQAFEDIRGRGKRAILCGGTGSYIHSLLISKPYSQIPSSAEFVNSCQLLSKEDLLSEINASQLPNDFIIDVNSKKRLIRSLEIIQFLKNNPDYAFSDYPVVKNYIAFGLNPALSERREKISIRLEERLKAGLIDEVNKLLDLGLTHEDLVFYGLEYKYVSYYLQGYLDYPEFHKKLETEIHRYAKRQMTFFRKMEKDGIQIHWLDTE
ncbi:tRNA (adenosine(37)-N6)-dimethylallyltransferase MiaA [Sphingobacterium hungaricum]|uniref:tRNA dimethylallyltransferase n=1 Tax=Sphingobacterium hungaricum TaxID=2082723 RepID=A0A928YPF5_9SPHI|nr:tRNA (adenosine(37)-N6)-dimethylallyltransferase MiaA [Sphingobacterium hungaricum]MBE8712874.1 tRNA (adenosine(37)-N6)-dimethylallyltransferase MiaA [Sphingobacterium hungaricum]